MRATLLLFTLLVAGCASFHEEHYFVARDGSGTPVNFLRVRVNGNTGLSRMRYVSGYYDERAVDLYFNEVKNAPDTATSGEIPPLFSLSQKNPGTEMNITPLTPAEGHGSLLMIFSSNPNSVANTIGQFAESQQAADAITNLINHQKVGEMRAQARRQSTTTLRFSTAAAEITTLIGTFPATVTTATDKTQAQTSALATLRALAVTLGGDGTFTTFADAKTWFAAQRAAQGAP
jgi:hypothetical protein